MSEAWVDALQGAWAELARHPARTRQFRTQRLAPELPLDVYAALRAADNAQCLLVPTVAPPSAFFEVGGMRLSSAPGDEGPLLVLSLEDLDRSDLFVTVCSDAVQAAAVEGEADSLPAFLGRLDAWRRFLKERKTGLSRHEVVGLLGELLVLWRLILADPPLLDTWVAPADGLHDFERQGHALEVKTSLGVATSLRISTLDQLDEAGLRQLDLLHVRLIETADGHSLGTLIEKIEGALPGDSARRAFSNALLRRGLMPDDAGARGAPVVEQRSLAAFRVGSTFPRLTRSVVPGAIRDAEYDLELRAIDGHTVDADAVFSAFAGAGADG
jgi:hypothetical protein